MSEFFSENSNNLRWISIHLSSIEPDVELPAPLFIYINGKFLEFKGKGDVISNEKYEQFILKKLPYLFIMAHNADIFDEWLEKIRIKNLESIAVNAGIENKELISIKQTIKEHVSRVFSGDMSDKAISNVTWETRAFVKIIGESPVANVSFVKLSESSKNIIEHSINVAILSVYLAHHLGYKQLKILESAFLGGLFHDIGKTTLDVQYYEEHNLDVLKQKLKEHPIIGRQALQSNASIGEEVLRIIEEHHEHNDGSGYPYEKRGAQLYDLTKLVSIADAFDNYVKNCPGNLADKSQYAIQQLEKDTGNIFDPQKLPKAIRALRLGIK
ncbi:MAG: HD domain-containing protein [Oligoflexia bacterium]|nr:HD domain-containing protein [Oligoflexia bacterium]